MNFKTNLLFTFTLLLFHTSCKYGSDSKLNVFEKNLLDRDLLMDSIYAQVNFDSNSTYPYMFSKKAETYYDDFVDDLYQDRFVNGEGSIWLGNKSLTPEFLMFQNILEKSVYHGMESNKYLKPIDSNIQFVLKSYKDKEDIPLDKAIAAEKGITKAFIKFSSDLLYGCYSPDSFFTHKEWSAKNDSVLDISLAINLLSEDDNEGNDFLDSFTPKHYWYKLLLDEMRNTLIASKDSLLDKPIYSQKSLILGDSGNVVQFIAAKLYTLNGIDISNGVSSNFDMKLDTLVRKFQISQGLEANGIVNDDFLSALNRPLKDRINILKYNFERWRWSSTKFDSTPEYVIVNIPAYRLFLYNNDSIVMSMNCVVGKVARKSPTIDARMTDIVLNPTWTVPPTILKKDILPSIQRRGGYAVSRRGLTAYDSRGRKVSPGRINSSNYKRFRYVQKPSYNNSLGTIKFNMPNREIVYIHDTNHRWGFNNRVRANSSGCVRVMHPRDMATYILGPQGYTREIIDSVITTKKTSSVKLDRDITSHFMYFTAAPDTHGVVVYYPDVYKHDDVFEQKGYTL